MAIVIDQTHVGRRASGIERVTTALLSQEALAPLPVVVERAGSSRAGILFRQAVAMPAKAATRRDTIWVFPGFPPSPAFGLLGDRVVLYVHDLFLINRRQDLNFAARAWLAPNFARALKTCKLFLTNSETTARELARHVADDVEILVYRPPAANVFGLSPRTPHAQDADVVRLGAIGTLEPRKNFSAAARIARALAQQMGRRVELHIIGRPGWGGEAERLQAEPGVVLHGFLPDAAARSVIEGFDALICTSHAEGLGLPLLECQFAALPVIAPDQPVFREVLQSSGLFIDPSNPDQAAAHMSKLFASPEAMTAARVAAHANIVRWNALAEADRQKVVQRLAQLADQRAAA